MLKPSIETSKGQDHVCELRSLSEGITKARSQRRWTKGNQTRLKKVNKTEWNLYNQTNYGKGEHVNIPKNISNEHSDCIWVLQTDGWKDVINSWKWWKLLDNELNKT